MAPGPADMGAAQTSEPAQGPAPADTALVKALARAAATAPAREPEPPPAARAGAVAEPAVVAPRVGEVDSVHPSRWKATQIPFIRSRDPKIAAALCASILASGLCCMRASEQL